MCLAYKLIVLFSRCRSIYVSQATNSMRKPNKRTKLSHEEEDGEGEGAPSAKISALLRYLFTKATNLYSPSTESLHPSEYDGINAPLPAKAEMRQSLLLWLPSPSSAMEARLSMSATRVELANDLIDTYFSIYHPRLPILDPVIFRETYFSSTFFDSSATGKGNSASLGESVLAAVLLWGAKFSDHPLIVDDRKECAEALGEGDAVKGGKGKNATTRKKPSEGSEEHSIPAALRKQGVSRICEQLFMRLCEICESKRVLHVPSDDNVITLLLMQGHMPAWPKQPASTCFADKDSSVYISCKSFEPTWFRTAVEHMRRLGYDRQEYVDAIEDDERRRRVMLCWWITLLIDAYSCAIYRRQPEIKFDDYTTGAPGSVRNSVIDAPNPSGATGAHE